MKKLAPVIVLAVVAAVMAIVGVALATATPTIQNGDFSDGTSIVWDNGKLGYPHWRGTGYESLGRPGKTALRHRVVQSNKPGDPPIYLDMKIVGTGTAGAGMKFTYIPFEGVYGDGANPAKPVSWKRVDGLQLDLNTLDSTKYYYLEADVYIVHHRLPDSGWYAGNEWPVEIRMMFVDDSNAKRLFYWGFLDNVDTQGLYPYTQIPNKTWYHYRSPELRELWNTSKLVKVNGEWELGGVDYPLDKIAGLSFAAKGWELRSRIANIAIVRYDSSQAISPDDQTYAP